MTYVMAHCDDNGMEHVMPSVMEDSDDKGNGAL